MEKQQIFEKIRSFLSENGFTIINEDRARPWGGFFVIDENQAVAFIDSFFPGTPTPSGLVSPKILLVEPDKKLSWQYHHRRSERWRLLEGRVGVVKSPTDTEGPLITLEKGDSITIGKEERHRLIGLNNWGVVAEIWVHADPENPSNEEDIIRVSDDFGR
jgi:hypothetical protein